MSLSDFMKGTPKEGTQALRNLLTDYDDIFRSLSLYVRFASKIDEDRRRAAKVLLETGDPEKDDLEKYQKVLDAKRGQAISELGKFARHNNRLIFQSAYNHFATFVSELIKLIYAQYPAALKTNYALKYKELMQFESKAEIVEYMVDKKINELSFQGIDKLNEDVASKLGFKFFESKRRARTLKKIAEKRNVLVHNRGIANSRYLQLSGDRFACFGEPIFLTNGTTLIMYLTKVAEEIDRRAVEHFKLESMKFEDA